MVCEKMVQSQNSCTEDSPNFENFTEEPKIFLRSNEGETYPINYEAAKQSTALKTILELEDLEIISDFGHIDPIIPFPNIDSKTLKRIIFWCEHTYDISRAALEKSLESEDIYLNKVYKDFLDINFEENLALVEAAKFLDIESLKKLACRGISQKINRRNEETTQEML